MNCKHQNIIITRKSQYEILQGWEKLMDQGDIDLGLYFIQEDQSSVFCEDCGKYFDD